MEKLTRRQKYFLTRFLELQSIGGDGLHYTKVAKYLGVGNVTAFEMLRLLEKRGFIISEYHLPEGNRRPGRSIVLFSPTAKAIELSNDHKGAEVENRDWRRIKGYLLKRLRVGKAGGYQSLLTELCAQIPQRRSPLKYLAEMITTIILSLESLRDISVASKLLNKLQRIGLPGEIDLHALAGVGFALSLVDRINSRVSKFYETQSEKCQAMLSRLNEENKAHLCDFVREVVLIVQA